MLQIRSAGLALALGSALLGLPVQAAVPEQPLDTHSRTALELTLYQQNLALVEEQRQLPALARGSRVILQGISPQMLVETLQIEGAGTIREQNLEQDLLSLADLLRQYSGRQVTLARFNSVTGSESRQSVRLLRAEGNQALIENTDGQIETLPLNHSGWRFIFPPPADGYRLQPQLSFITDGSRAPGHARLRYLTRGLGWQMDYVLNLNAAGDRLSLQGLATLNNQSGQAWPEARVKLLAGTVNQPEHGLQAEAMSLMRAPTRAQSDGMAAPSSLQDYYLYPLPGTLTLADRQQKQIPLIQRRELAARIHYQHQIQVASHQQLPPQRSPAQVLLSFTAPTLADERTPLPAGQVRVFRPDASGQLQFVGGSTLTATPPGEQARLALGEAFDVSVEYTQTAFNKVFDGYEASYEVRLRNRSDALKPFRLLAAMPLPYRLLETSLTPADTDGAGVEWLLDLAAGTEQRLTFTVKLIRA